jgi:hypothetical protein
LFSQSLTAFVALAQITEAVLLLKVEGWTIEFHLDPNPSPARSLRHGPRWLSALEPVSFVDLHRAEPHLTQYVPGRRSAKDRSQRKD